MAGDLQLNENERNVFALDGVTGYLIAVVLLLSILAFLTVNAISAQANNARAYYKIDQNLDAIKFKSKDNYTHRHIVNQ